MPKLMRTSALMMMAYQVAADCGQYQDCTKCLHPPDPADNCGWCSPKPAVSIPGYTPLTRCMDHTSKGWLCPDLYMKDGCIAGYVCNKTTGTCNIGPPGEGGHKDKCEAECHKPAPPPPPQFVCNVTTLTCEEAPKQGQPTKKSCDNTCGHHTPSELIGLWRGIDIQSGFSIGEWVVNFSTSTVTWGPSGTPTMYAADVAMTGPQRLQLSLTSPPSSKGEIRLATYSNAGWPTGPETWSFSLAIQHEGSHVAPPDALPGSAMGLAGIDVFVFHGCHEYHHLCDFSAAFTKPTPPPTASAARQLTSASATTIPSWLIAPQVDSCKTHKSCGECINAQGGLCGWCDGIVTFSDGTTCGEDGNGCCGGASAFSTCDPSFRKACPVICDWNSHKPAGKHPFCREATSKEFNSSMPKYGTCAELNASQSCNVPDFGHYCDKTVGTGQCKTVKTKDDCAKTPGCNVSNPVCDDAVCDSHHKYITYCDPDSGCKGPVSKAECKLDPHCDPDHPTGCDPTVCKAPVWFTCDAGSHQCNPHQGKLPPPGTIYFNTTADCKKACIDHDISGIWRGLRVDKGFVADEWDFEFSKVTAGATVTFKSKKTGTKSVGTYAIGAAMSSEPFGAFEFIITLTSGGTLKGLFSTQNNDGQPAVGPFTRFMYLGLPLQASDTAVSYDDAMAAVKQEFVLVACLPAEAGCDFSSAAPLLL